MDRSTYVADLVNFRRPVTCPASRKIDFVNSRLQEGFQTKNVYFRPLNFSFSRILWTTCRSKQLEALFIIHPGPATLHWQGYASWARWVNLQLQAREKLKRPGRKEQLFRSLRWFNIFFIYFNITAEEFNLSLFQGFRAVGNAQSPNSRGRISLKFWTTIPPTRHQKGKNK